MYISLAKGKNVKKNAKDTISKMVLFKLFFGSKLIERGNENPI